MSCSLWVKLRNGYGMGMLGEVNKENDGAPVRGSGDGYEKPTGLFAPMSLAWVPEGRSGKPNRSSSI